MSEAWKRVSGWSEGGGDDELPPFGNKARKWFMRLLRPKVSSGWGGIQEDEIEPVLDWFRADPMPYVEWTDSDKYHGRGYSNGAWEVDWDAVNKGCIAARAEIRAEANAARFSTLDSWLRADLDGDFRWGSLPEGGSENLSKEVKTQLAARARDRRRKWPLGCVDCGKTFYRRAGQKGMPLRCTGCLEKRKTLAARARANRGSATPKQS